MRGDAVCGVHVCERRAGLTDAVCVSQEREVGEGESRGGEQLARAQNRRRVSPDGRKPRGRGLFGLFGGNRHISGNKGR